MTFFDNIFNKIFSKNDKVGTPAVHEVLKRSERDIKLFNRWKGHAEQEALMREIIQAYYYKKSGIQSEIIVHLFNSAYANGFAITYLPRIGEKNFQHLFDYFRDQVLTMNYRLAGSDRMIVDKKDFVETREKHYLKPPTQVEAMAKTKKNRMDQLYGNISLEYVLINTQPSYIKVLASIYSDSLYKQALDFDDFAKHLFNNNATG